MILLEILCLKPGDDAIGNLNCCAILSLHAYVEQQIPGLQYTLNTFVNCNCR